MPRDDTRAALARTRQAADTSAQPFRTSAGRDELGRITVDLHEHYRPFKAACALEGRKMNEVVRELVAQWVAEHPLGT